MARLSGRVALVTGGARGIGSGIASRLYEEGASVVIADINGEGALRAAYELGEGADGASGRRAMGLTLDISKPDQSREIVAHIVQELGSLDILVNNAGVGQIKRMEEITEQEWDWIFDINVKGLFFCLQAVAAQMKAQGSGKIVNLASIAGRQGEALVLHYCASKAAVISITQSAARALAPYHVNVNAVAPGIVDTAFWVEVDKQFAAIEGKDVGQPKRERVGAIPLGRIETPEDVASAVAFLASADADYITGQTLNVEGGMIMC